MMLSAPISSLVWVTGAMLKSYRFASRDFFRSRQRTILLLGSVLMPLASIPEALLSPLLILGDPKVDPLGRCFTTVIDLVLWNAWIASQRHFIPPIRDVSVVTVFMRPQMTAICVALRYCILSWPAIFLFLALQCVRDESGRAQFAQMALCVVVISSGVVSGSRLNRAAPYGAARPFDKWSAYPLLSYALSGIAPSTDPRVPCMHACSCLAVILTYVVLSRLPSSYGVVTISLIGSLVALLPLRALLDLASQRSVVDCPMLVACPRFRTVENCQVVCCAALLFAASMTASALGQGRVDAVHDGLFMTALFMTLMFLAFVSCRNARVSRWMENGVLCVVVVTGITLECI